MTVASRARAMFTDRAVVQRDAATGTDDFGHPIAPNYQSHATIPCRLWWRSAERVNDDRKDAQVGELICGMALDADVTADDIVTEIQDRRGTTIVSGPIRLVSPQRRRTHYEWTLRKFSSDAP